MEGAYTNCYSGSDDDTRLRGDCSSRLIKVPTADWRIMRVIMKHTLGYFSHIAVDAPTRMHEAAEKDEFYKMSSLLDRYPHRDTLIVLGRVQCHCWH